MSQNDALRERIARLEREVRLFKRGAATMLALLSTMIVLSGAKRGDVGRSAGSARRSLEVRKLTVVDEGGAPRIVLEVDKDGPRVALNDGNKRERAELWVSGDGPVLSLADEHGQVRTLLAAANDRPALLLFDENAKRQAALAANKDSSVLWFKDENGTVRVSLASDKDGPSLSLDDERGEARAVFGASSLVTVKTGVTENTGPSAITLFGRDGKRIWRAP